MVNPYLMAAALLKAFDDGIRRKLDPGEPEQRNIYQAMEEGKQVKKLPMSLGEALDRWSRTRSSARRCPARCSGCSCTTSGTSGSGSWPPSPSGTSRRTWTACRESARARGSPDRAVPIKERERHVRHRGHHPPGKERPTSAREMTAMLQSMKHRGPDSSGFSVYGRPAEGELVMRFKVAEQEDLRARLRDPRRAEASAGGGGRPHRVAGRPRSSPRRRPPSTPSATASDTTATCAASPTAVEDVEGAEILSIGNALELIKDLGDARQVCGSTSSDGFVGTHAIGHVRMATESDVDICSAHPFWAYPFKDISVVHNGQLTNYWGKRRRPGAARATASCPTATPS